MLIFVNTSESTARAASIDAGQKILQDSIDVYKSDAKFFGEDSGLEYQCESCGEWLPPLRVRRHVKICFGRQYDELHGSAEVTS